MLFVTDAEKCREVMGVSGSRRWGNGAGLCPCFRAACRCQGPTASAGEEPPARFRPALLTSALPTAAPQICDPEVMLMTLHPSAKNILGPNNLAFMHGPEHKNIRSATSTGQLLVCGLCFGWKGRRGWGRRCAALTRAPDRNWSLVGRAPACPFRHPGRELHARVSRPRACFVGRPSVRPPHSSADAGPHTPLPLSFPHSPLSLPSPFSPPPPPLPSLPDDPPAHRVAGSRSCRCSRARR